MKNCIESVNDKVVSYRYNEKFMLLENNKINFAKTKKHEVVDEMCEVSKYIEKELEKKNFKSLNEEFLDQKIEFLKDNVRVCLLNDKLITWTF